MYHQKILAFANLTVVHTSYSQTAEEVVVAEVEHLSGQRLSFLISGGGRYLFQNNIKKRREIFALIFEFAHRYTLAADSVDRGEIRLFIGSAEFQEKLQHLFLSTVWVGGRLINLVDDHNRLKPEFKGFLKHEACLWHGTLLSVDN